MGKRIVAYGLLASFGATLTPGAANAYLFWKKPDFSGTPVTGGEPGIVLPMPGATDREFQASLLWSLRAGLNVAALKCQFAPMLATVGNYNSLLSGHGTELNAAYNVVQSYFKRTGGKTWQTAFDQYTTRTYNGFSTFHGELGFCETAALIGRDAMAQRRGDLHLTAEQRMREFRNSLLPAGDQFLPPRPYLTASQPMPSLERMCWDKKDQYVERKCGPMPAAAPPSSLASAAAPGAS